MSVYRVTVVDQAERRAEIGGKVAAATVRRAFFMLRNRKEELPVIQVSIRLPVYRMENYRTQTRQLSYIRRNDLPSTYFSNGQEDEEAQQAQHETLYQLADKGLGDTVMKMTASLGHDRQQTEPLLITHEGVVLNGNRRLAAMREMYQSDQDAFASFATIDVMVLPADVTQTELKEVEFRLQMQRQTLLPYDWQDQALAVRDLHQSGFSNKQIQSLMRLEKESEVAALLDQLREAEVYLEECLQKPYQYELVAEHDQLFGDLQIALGKKSGGEKELARRIGHVMAKHSKSFGSRVYDYKAAFGTKLKEVVERLADRRGIELTEPDVDEDIFGDDGTGDVYAPVRDLLKEPAESAALADEIRDIYDEIKAEQREEDIGRRPERALRKANALLNEVTLEQADTTTYGSIQSQLVAVIARAEGLRADIEQRIQRAAARMGG